MSLVWHIARLVSGCGTMGGRGRFAWFGLALASACVEAPIAPVWPPMEDLGARVVVTTDPSGLRHYFRAIEGGLPAFVSNLDPDAPMLLLDYACADLEALGFRPLAGDGLEPPSTEMRSPDRVFVLDTVNAPAFRTVDIADDPVVAAGLGLELRFPSVCRAFDPVTSPVEVGPRERSRFLLSLPDQSVLLMTAMEADRPEAQRAFAYRFWGPGPDEFERHALPLGAPADAGAIDSLGTLWLYGRSGRLSRGSPDDLDRFETAFETMPAPPRAHSCDAIEAGTHNDSVLSARTLTGTTAALLLVDGSGTVLLFDGQVWHSLRDPVGMGQTQFLCRVAPSEVLWIGEREALLLNRALFTPSPQVIRLSFDERWAASFVDDRSPAEVEGVERLLDLGPRGIYAGGGRGRIARRSSGVWSQLQPDIALARNIATLFAGPDGSLIAGNGGEGLAQYWPEAEGGPVACGSVALTSGVRDAGRVDEDLVVALPSNEGALRSVQMWRFSPAGVCELPPN